MQGRLPATRRASGGALLAGWIALGALLTGPAGAEKPWREKTGCRLVENPSNDGDSFHVKVGTRTYIFRLLFVDCPETDRSVPERVAEQAAYFGITEEQSVKVGKEAQRFTRDLLKDEFTVFTQFEDALGRSAKDRDYAMVKVGDLDLGVALVSNGLARIYGRQEVPDDGPSETTVRFRLKSAENDARKNRRGAWGLATPLNRFQQLNPAPVIAEQTRRTTVRTAVYQTNDPGRVLGYLAEGRELTVLGAHDAQRVRVRFTLTDGRSIEGLCQRAELGL